MNDAFSIYRGFTLVELMTVVAVIGILAGIVLVGLNAARPRTRDAQRAGDVKSIGAALEVYYSAHKSYPLCSFPTNDLAGHIASMTCLSTALVGEGLFTQFPTDPQSPNQSYAYDNVCGTPSANDTQHYRLFAATEGAMGGLQKNWFGENYVGSSNCVDPTP